MKLNEHGLATLKQLCLENISQCILSTAQEQEENIAVLDIRIVTVPPDISQEIFDFCLEEIVTEKSNSILEFFLLSPFHTPLRQICLRNACRADINLILNLVLENLETLTHIDVRGCGALPKKFWFMIQKAPQLRSLKTTNLLSPIRCPRLDTLVVDWKPKRLFQRVQRRFQRTYYDNLLEHVIRNLTYLDLSWCTWAKRLKILGNATHLEVLILRNCDISSLIDDISQLHCLRILDISVGLEHEFNHSFNGIYANPEDILEQVVSCLTNLEYLDISGTNLSSAENENIDKVSSLVSRSKPLKFLGMYNQRVPLNSQALKIPALHISGSGNAIQITEAIKRNIDMPKTLRSQISKLKSIQEPLAVDVNMLFGVQIKMLWNIRIDEHFRFCALKCLSNFIDHLENPAAQIDKDKKINLFRVLNRLNFVHSEESGKVSELSLRLTFQIFLKLLSTEDKNDNAISREVKRLAKFLMSLKRTHFVYFKTEATLFRLLYILSLDHNVCTYINEYGVVQSCFEFFKTIQVYLGFSLRVYQTSEIVSITWKSILNFTQSSDTAIHDFFKFSGLSWMYAHLSWFSFDERTQRELRRTFLTILNLLELYVIKHSNQSHPSNPEIVSRSVQDLMLKVTGMVKTSTAF